MESFKKIFESILLEIHEQKYWFTKPKGFIENGFLLVLFSLSSSSEPKLASG